MAEAQKLDLKKELKYLYQPPPSKVVEVDVPPMNFIMIDGKGDPNTAEAYQQALEALYGLAYTIKFSSKKKLGMDYTVMALEGLWWAEEMGEAYGDFDFTADKSSWLWTMMIMQPDLVTREIVDAAVIDLRKKKNPPALEMVRFECFHEGLATQTMHIGPYSAEKPTMDRLHHYIADCGCEPAGKHHEIYLGDPRRTQPEKLKTVIRQPMRKRIT